MIVLDDFEVDKGLFDFLSTKVCNPKAIELGQRYIYLVASETYNQVTYQTKCQYTAALRQGGKTLDSRAKIVRTI